MRLVVARQTSAVEPTVGTMLRRGIVRHCPNCGSGHLFRHWFRMVDRCPRCGIRFEREAGFFLGAFVINFGVGEGLIAVLLFVFIVLESTNSHVSTTTFIVVAIVLSIIAALFFYPFSKTIWAALDLAMNRPGPEELEEAAHHAATH